MKTIRLSSLAFLVFGLVVQAEKTPELPRPMPPAPIHKSKRLPAVTVPSRPARLALAAGASLLIPREMKLLVLAGDGNEPSYAAIRSFLDYIGIPYDAIVTKDQALPVLSSTAKGNYQGIILATGSLVHSDGVGGWTSGLTPEEWTALDTYTADFGVRTAVFYAFPEARYGLTNLGAISSGFFTASFAPAAADVFPYLTLNPIDIVQSWGYKAGILSGAEQTKPILMGEGAILGAIHKNPEGSEYLALTFDHAAHLIHSMALNYGIFNWVTKGVFIGARKIYLSPQVDDHFLPDDLYQGGLAPCAPGDPAPCETLRITGADLKSVADWQANLNNKGPQFKNFKVTHAFNGFGTTTAGGAQAGDTLTSESHRLRNSFYWVNHTWDHENLDCYSDDCHAATYLESLREISLNIVTSLALRLPLDSASMVTPAISGLKNPSFLRAARTLGIRYLVSDSSQPDHPPYTPNTGVRSSIDSSILMIPRRPTHLYYNTHSERTGVAGSLPDEFNFLYPSLGYTYDQIINLESNAQLAYMLRYEIYPQMYHQTNLWRYNGSTSLFTHLIDEILKKFSYISNLPVISLEQSDIGREMEARMAVNNAKVRGTLTPGYTIKLTGSRSASVPITGICATGCETYGTQKISKISVTSGRTTTVKILPAVGK
jgi:hypothetical protein